MHSEMGSPDTGDSPCFQAAVLAEAALAALDKGRCADTVHSMLAGSIRFLDEPDKLTHTVARLVAREAASRPGRSDAPRLRAEALARLLIAGLSEESALPGELAGPAEPIDPVESANRPEPGPPLGSAESRLTQLSDAG